MNILQKCEIIEQQLAAIKLIRYKTKARESARKDQQEMLEDTLKALLEELR